MRQRPNRIASVLDVNHLMSVIHNRCNDLGVTMEFDPDAPTAYTNGKHIVMPAIEQPITKEKMDLLYGYTIHECGHHQRPDCFKILNTARPPEHLCALYNIIEDDGMERERSMEWRGDMKAICVMNGILIRKVSKSWAPTLEKGKQGKANVKALATLCVQQLSRLDYDRISDSDIAAMQQGMPADVAKLRDELVKEGWVERFQGGTDPHITWDIAVDLAKRLYPGKDKEYDKVCKSGHTMKGGPRDSSKDTWKDRQPSLNDKQKKGKKKGKAKGRKPDPEGSVISWKDCVLSQHNEWESTAKKGAAGSTGIDWEGMLENVGGVKLMPLKEINVIDMSKGQGDGHKNSSLYMPNNAESRTFANRVRRYLQAQVRSRVRRHQYNGRIDKSSIVKLLLPPIEGGDYNRKIFYTQDKAKLKDTAIFILTDWSGSMRGNKMKSAADASQRLVYTMERILKIPVALACFSNGRSKCDIGYIKPFGTRGMDAREIARRFAKFGHWTSANNDADALNWAYHQLAKRKETRKILIVLSDGCPAGSWAGHGGNNLKFICKQIEQSGKIELYGVGIHSSAVKSYYKNYRVLQNPGEINNTLFNLIKEGDTT